MSITYEVTDNFPKSELLLQLLILGMTQKLPIWVISLLLIFRKRLFSRLLSVGSLTGRCLIHVIRQKSNFRIVSIIHLHARSPTIIVNVCLDGLPKRSAFWITRDLTFSNTCVHSFVPALSFELWRNNILVDACENEKQDSYSVEWKLEPAKVEEQRSKDWANKHSKTRKGLKYAVHARQLLLGERHHHDFRGWEIMNCAKVIDRCIDKEEKETYMNCLGNQSQNPRGIDIKTSR